MSRLPLVSLTCAFALVLGGCDRESTERVQPEGEATEAGGELTGKVDRSFAGETIPAVVLTDPSGATLDLADLDGKPVLVNLWATWCVPCVTEMPLLDELAAELGDGIEVLTVSEDIQGAEKVVPFFEQQKLTNLPQWMDPNNELAVAYGGGTGLPLTVLYDDKGEEVWRVLGGYDWSSAEARELVAEAAAT